MGSSTKTFLIPKEYKELYYELAQGLLIRDKLKEGVHDLLRSVKLTRLNVMLTEDLEERMKMAADILDTVEKELERLEQVEVPEVPEVGGRGDREDLSPL